MKELTGIFSDVFSPIMGTMGFTKKGRVFHKLVNEKIIQRVYLLYYERCYAFTVGVDITPLCCGFIIRTSDEDGYHIDDFYGRRGGWTVLDEEYKDRMPEILEQCEKILFPYLEAARDYPSARDVFLELCHKTRYPPGWMFHLNLACGQYETAIAQRAEGLRRWGESRSAMQAARFNQLEQEYKNVVAAVEQGDFAFIHDLLERNERISLESYKANFL